MKFSNFSLKTSSRIPTSIDAAIPSRHIACGLPHFRQPQLEGDAGAVRRGDAQRDATEIRRNRLGGAGTRGDVVGKLEGRTVSNVFELCPGRVADQLLRRERETFLLEGIGIQSGNDYGERRQRQIEPNE